MHPTSLKVFLCFAFSVNTVRKFANPLYELLKNIFVIMNLFFIIQHLGVSFNIIQNTTKIPQNQRFAIYGALA